MAADLEAAIARQMAEIRNDCLSGAVEITRRAAELLLGLAEPGSPRFEQLLRETCTHLAAAQPQMASVFRLANAALLSGPLPGSVADACRSFLAAMLNAGDRIAAFTTDLLPPEATVLTHSAGNTVEQALLAARAAGRLRGVICTESRPLCEGTLLASRLAASGIQVSLIVDAGAASVFHRVDCVLTGADAVDADGVTNKVGTLALAHLSQAMGKPLYILCTQQKFLPPKRRLPREQPRDPQEISAGLARGVMVENRYFDRTPLSLITGLITEEGLLNAREILRRISRIEVHPALVQDQN